MLALPLGPSNSYAFSTASHGIRRRSAASASRARVNSFSFTSSRCRAASHSCGDTILGRFILLASVSRSISFNFILFSSGLLSLLFLKFVQGERYYSAARCRASGSQCHACYTRRAHLLRRSFLSRPFVCFFQILRQAIERSLPELAVFLDPFRGLFQRLGL